MEGHKSKEKLASGHAGASEIFKSMEVNNNFHKDIEVKDSSCVLPFEVGALSESLSVLK